MLKCCSEKLSVSQREFLLTNPASLRLKQLVHKWAWRDFYLVLWGLSRSCNCDRLGNGFMLHAVAVLCLLQWPPYGSNAFWKLFVYHAWTNEAFAVIYTCTFIPITQCLCKLPLHNCCTTFVPFRDVIDLDTDCVHALFPLTRPSWWAVVCLSCWEHFHKSQHANQHMASQATKDHQLTHASPTVSYLNICHVKYEKNRLLLFTSSSFSG